MHHVIDHGTHWAVYYINNSGGFAVREHIHTRREAEILAAAYDMRAASARLDAVLKDLDAAD